MLDQEKTQTAEQLKVAPITKLSIRGRWTSVMAAAGLSLLVVACGVAPAARGEATSSMELLDVTGAGAGKVSKKNESYWQKSNGEIMRCYHQYPIGSSYMDDPTGCESFLMPVNVPKGSTLEAINKGIGQKNLSIWSSPNGRLVACEHDDSWSTIGDATVCKEFQRPIQINPESRLSSLNSGSGQEAQSFWNNPDGTITACDHEKSSSGFLGFGAKGFGEAKACGIYGPPIDKLPKGFGRFKMVAINSDGSRPMQTFWQSDQEVVAQCFHEKKGGMMTNKKLGTAQECQLWKTPKN